MDARAAAATITEHAEQALAGSGVVVDQVTVQEAGRRRLVRVLLARDLAGLAPDDRTSVIDPLSLDEVAEATRAVSAAMDTCAVMGERPYTLEVSSAGVDRPLTTTDQFRRNVGRLVKVTLTEGTTTGRLVAVGDTELVLEDQPEPVPWDQVVKGQVQVEFTRPDGKDV